MQCTLAIEETAVHYYLPKSVLQLYTHTSNSDSQESPVGIIIVFSKACHCSRSQETPGNRIWGKVPLTSHFPSFIAKEEIFMRKQCSL